MAWSGWWASWASLERSTPAFIEGVREAETLGHFDRTKPPAKMTFKPGQPVRVIAGPFTGHMVEFMAAKDNESRVRVLLTLFGRPGPMTIDRTALEAA
jgi:transcription antitermination factor NusG